MVAGCSHGKAQLLSILFRRDLAFKHLTIDGGISRT